MRLRFSKWQAGGNDFVLLGPEAADRAASACREMGVEMGDAARALCDRHGGVGADGLLAVLGAEGGDGTDRVDGVNAAEWVEGGANAKDGGLRMGFWNPDGSAAGMCGNGARCFAAAAWERGAPRKLAIHVADARYEAEPDERTGWIWLSFPQQVGVRPVEDPAWRILVCHPGTDHIVVLADDAADVPGSAAAWNRLAGAGTGGPHSGADEEDAWRRAARGLRENGRVLVSGGNVNLVWNGAGGALNVLTYERGVEAFTRSCGTGAVAAALAWAAAGEPTGRPDPGSKVFQAVSTPGGPLGIRYRWNGTAASAGGAEAALFTDIQLGGPARNVFEGELDLRDLLLPAGQPHARACAAESGENAPSPIPSSQPDAKLI